MKTDKEEAWLEEDSKFFEEMVRETVKEAFNQGKKQALQKVMIMLNMTSGRPWTTQKEATAVTEYRNMLKEKFKEELKS